MRFVQKIMENGAVCASGGKKRYVNWMPCQCGYVLFMTAEETYVSHHAEIKYTGGLITSTCREKLASSRLK
jgi:uncharacterized cysteine cluster protein YcgN (CxxCxxCC family)